MKKTVCPGCGAGYNGRRCRNCGYEHFSEEIAHRGHTHRGEPLVISAPVRRPIPRKDPFGCEKKTRTKRPMLRFFILLAAIYSLMPMFRNWGLKLEDMERKHSSGAVQPEPALLPENGVILHEQKGLTVFVTREQLSDLSRDFSLLVRNESNRTVTLVAAGDIHVNGIRLPEAAMVFSAEPGETGRGWLYTEDAEWEAAGIDEVRSLSFTLTVLRQDGRVLFETDEIRLTGEGA